MGTRKVRAAAVLFHPFLPAIIRAADRTVLTGLDF